MKWLNTKDGMPSCIMKTCLVWLNGDYEFGMYSHCCNQWVVFIDGNFTVIAQDVDIENLLYFPLSSPEDAEQ